VQQYGCFRGKPKQSNRYNSYSNQWLKRNRKKNADNYPICTEHNGGYFFEIYQNDDVTGVFQYETKWSPNTEEVQKIAEHYNVNFTQDYEELGNCVYGRATFADELLTDVFGVRRF
jgi:hypothetical protein